MSQAFSTVRRGEIAELHALLIHTKIDKRKTGMKKLNLTRPLLQ